MKLRATMLAIPLAAGLALAQSTSGAGAQTTGSQTSSGGQQQTGAQSGSQADRTGQTSQAGSTAGSQSGSTTGTQADRTSGTGSGEPAQLKTMTYKGTLVDLSCGGGSASTPAAAAGQAADRSSTATTGASTATAGQSGTTAGSSTAGGSMAAGAAGTASRAAGGECPASANSTNLGLKMDNGQTVRFDLVGNQRAQDALKNNKGWNKNLSANKPLKVKISGVLQGDKLIVSSIN